MTLADLRRWRLCLLTAAVAAAYALSVCAIAGADPLLDQDLSLARALLPVGHPCRSGPVEVLWTPGLTIGGKPEAAGAPRGLLTGSGEWVDAAAGGLLRCVVWVDPQDWAEWTRCEDRRLVFHEVSHWAGAVDGDPANPLMSGDSAVRDTVAVPGCAALVEPLGERVLTRVLAMVPAGWSAWCGHLRRRVIRCYAESPEADRGRYFRARTWGAGAGFAVVRLRRAPSAGAGYAR